MVKRSVIFALLAVIALSAAAWSAGEELTYSGPFVSVNSPLRLCATATDDNGSVPGLGLWFQAWDMAGSARTNGPFNTIQTNGVGKACSQSNLLAGLYEVQAFGTGDFDGVSSLPVVVSNFRGDSWSSAGIATFGGSPMTPPRDAPFGIYLGSLHPAMTTVRSTGNGIVMATQSLNSSPGGSLKQFLWLDPFNPNGPTRVEATFREWFFAASISPDHRYGRVWMRLDTPCYVQVGGAEPTQGLLQGDGADLMQGRLQFTLDTGVKPLFVPYHPLFVERVNDGTFTMKVSRPNGQVIYDVSGSFKGTSCVQWLW